MPHELTTAPVNPAPQWRSDYIEAFLRKVAARPNVTNWQVQQARVSLEIYYERFRGIALAPRPNGVAAPTADKRPAPLRETTPSRPMDQESITVQHSGPPSPCLMAEATLLSDGKSSRTWRLPADSRSRRPEPLPLLVRRQSLGNRQARFRRVGGREFRDCRGLAYR